MSHSQKSVKFQIHNGQERSKIKFILRDENYPISKVEYTYLLKEKTRGIPLTLCLF